MGMIFRLFMPFFLISWIVWALAPNTVCERVDRFAAPLHLSLRLAETIVEPWVDQSTIISMMEFDVRMEAAFKEFIAWQGWQKRYSVSCSNTSEDQS